MLKTDEQNIWFSDTGETLHHVTCISWNRYKCEVLCGLQGFHTQFILFSYTSAIKVIGYVLQPLFNMQIKAQSC